MSARRWAAVGGILYVVLAIVASDVLVGHPASEEPTGEELVAFYATDSARKLLGAWVELVALFMFGIFVAGLHATLRDSPDAPPWLASALLVGGIATMAVKLASFPAIVVLMQQGASMDPGLASALVAVNDAAFVVTWGTLALFVGAASAIILDTRLLPRWLGWVGALLGLALLGAAAAWGAGLSFAPAALTLLWIAAVSVTLAWPRRA